MEAFLLLGGLVVALLAIGAWQRVRRLAEQLGEVDQRLIDQLDRIRALEVVAARQREARQTRPAPEMAVPAPAPPAAQAPTPQPTQPPHAVPEPTPVADEPGPEEFPPEAIDAEPDQPPPGFVATPPTAEPSSPSPVVAWLMKGNPLAKLGVVLMFFGLAYLLKFATERGLLPIEIRLAGAALIAMSLLGVGWRLRLRSPVYALTLQGGSIGALYLTSFAAFRVYSLLPHGVVFALLVLICAASVTLAVLQRAQSLALLASLGGYLAPVLLSTGGGNHVALFSYYAILSGGILAVSFWQSWRPLNLIGFAFTFGVGALWGSDRYTPELYGSTQFFLALNLVLYGILAALAAVRRVEGRADALVDGTLVFGTPLVGFGLQVGLTRHWEYGPAFSSLAFGAVYLPLAWFTLRRWPERARRLTISFLALGGGFVTLAIPLALSARWTSMAWALEGLGVLWAGRAQRHVRMIWSGTGLLGLAGAAAWIAWLAGLDSPTFFMVGTTLAVTWLAGGWMWSRDENAGGIRVSPLLLFGGVLAWTVLIVDGSDRILSGRDAVMLGLTAMGVTAVVWTGLASRFGWPSLGEWSVILWPYLLVALALRIVLAGHPLSSGWWNLGWLITFLAAWHVLRRGRQRPDLKRRPVQHATFLWLVFGFAASEAAWRLDRLGWGADEWKASGMLALAAAFVFVLWQLAARRHWALSTYPRAYWFWGLLPPLITASFLLVSANFLDGRSPAWPYVPLVNPIELGAAFALLMGVVWRRQMQPILGPSAALLHVPLIAALVWWTNGLLLRTLSTVGGVAWTPVALWDSAFLQTSMAIAWTVAALLCMAFAARRGRREAWFAGAGALAVVVVKLFLVDSARGGGLARAISFIGVAILVLVIGYLAPLPPRAHPKGESST